VILHFQKKRQLYFSLKGIVIVTLAVAMLFSCKKNDVEIVRNLTQTDSLPSQSVIRLETVYTDSGKIKIRVKAPLVNRFASGEKKEQNKVFFPQGILVFFYNSNGVVKASIIAKHAIYHENQKLWEASDSVVAKNINDEILNTELLYWDEKAEKIYSPKFVKITTDDQVIFGEGFESDQAMSAWTITHVKGTIYQKHGK